MQASVYIGQSS